jgi:hypothetical protein
VPQFHHSWLADARRADGSLDFEWVVAHGHMHFHVWTQDEMVTLLRHAGFRILVVMDRLLERNDSFLVIAQVHEAPSAED